MKVELLSGNGTRQRQPELTVLLADAVEHGARLGFSRPLDRQVVDAYWQEVAGAVARGEKELLVALDERGRVVGSAQLLLNPMLVGPDRARVQKMMVKHSCRGRGIGAALMSRLEQAAAAGGRTELVLDTTTGAGGASAFCRRLGYQSAGDLTTRPPMGSDAPLTCTTFIKTLPSANPLAKPGASRPPLAATG